MHVTGVASYLPPQHLLEVRNCLRQAWDVQFEFHCPAAA